MKSSIAIVLGFAVLMQPFPVVAQRGRGAGPGAAPPTPRVAANVDLTGYWVSVVTEDWRYRMVTPAQGDYQGVPLTPAARKIADSWDPAKEAASGELCKAYGAPALLTRRLTGRWLLYPPFTPNLLWEPLLRRIYEAAPGDDGPYYFFICRKPPAT